MKYTSKWDLASIPDEPLYSEVARRRAAKRVYETKPVECDRCGKTCTATTIRYRCPDHTPPAARGVVTVRRKKMK